MTKPKGQKLLIGKTKCTCCGEFVPVHENSETKTLSYPCGWCGNPAYAKADGSDHYKKALANVVRTPAAVPEPTPAPPPSPPPIDTPPAPKRTGLFTTT